MTETPIRYWNRYVAPEGGWRTDPRTKQPVRPPGEDLAAFRAGLGHEAGTVPKLWPYYTCPIDDRQARKGELSDQQIAEHVALALYGLHQQAQATPMHRPGINLGQALKILRWNDKFSEQAVDARVAATVTATSVSALQARLRGLITQLRVISQPLDYDQLMADIGAWHRSDSRQRVRRAWGIGYHAWDQAPSDRDTQQPSTPSTT